MTSVTYSLGPKRPLRPNRAAVDRLKAAVESIDPNIDIIIYSGRQHEHQQYGSPRHSTGNTVDFSLERNGKRIQTGDTDHLAVFAAMPRFGLNEIGVGMANGGMHAGFGSDDPSIKANMRRPPLAWGYPGGTVSRLNATYPDYVKELQASLGVTVDGVFGNETSTALAAIDDANPPMALSAFAASPQRRGPTPGSFRTAQEEGLGPERLGPTPGSFRAAQEMPEIVPIPRPRPDLSTAPRRPGMPQLPTPASGRADTSRKSIATEIEEIQEKMRSDRRGYFADDALQARYRELIAMRERNGRASRKP